MSDGYRFNLHNNENALNIVLGSALGAYIGVALSIAPDEIDLSSFALFLVFLYPLVSMLLAIQNWAREKMWKPFLLSAIIVIGLLYVTYKFSQNLPLNSGIYLVIVGLWIFSVYIDTLKNVIIDNYFSRMDER